MADFPTWASCPLFFPVDNKVSVVEGVFFLGLPALSTGYRPDQVDTLLMAFDQQIDLNIALIHNLGLWFEVPSSQIILNSFRHFDVMYTGRGCFHLCNQAGMFFCHKMLKKYLMI